MDLIDLMIGDKLKGVPRKIAYIVVWMLMMLFAAVALVGTVVFGMGLFGSFAP